MPRPRKIFHLTLITAIVILKSSIITQAESPTDEWKLTWRDEFNGDVIDETKWEFDIGNGFYNYEANQWIAGWGNNELQYYTERPTNAFVKNGKLHIRVQKESLHGCGYTSAKLKTRKRNSDPLFNQKYGRFEIRAKLPTGQGIWPALWMLPQDDKYGPWAASGEIDILEARGQEPEKILGTLHYGGRWPVNSHSSREYKFPDNGNIADFHVYAVEWEPGEIRWYIDDHKYATQSFWWSTSKTNGSSGAQPQHENDLNPWPAPFNQPFYLIMNVAVGGNFLGNPDKNTKFPAEMLVDYVRVYEKVGGYRQTKKRGEGKLPF